MARRIRAAIAIGALTIAAVSASLVTTAGAETPSSARAGTAAVPSYEKHDRGGDQRDPGLLVRDLPRHLRRALPAGPGQPHHRRPPGRQAAVVPRSEAQLSRRLRQRLLLLRRQLRRVRRRALVPRPALQHRSVRSRARARARVRSRGARPGGGVDAGSPPSTRSSRPTASPGRGPKTSPPRSRRWPSSRAISRCRSWRCCSSVTCPGRRPMTRRRTAARSTA